MSSTVRLTAFGTIERYLEAEDFGWAANHAQCLVEHLANEGYAIVKVPTVMHKGPDDTEVSAFRGAADRIDGGYEPGGSNVKRAISQLLRWTADAIERTPVQTIPPQLRDSDTHGF